MDGRQSMVIGGPWATAAWRENAPEVYENYVVCPHPQLDPANPKSFIHTYALAVSAGSKNQTEAWKFLNFLLSDPGDMLAQAGYINGRRAGSTRLRRPRYRGLDRMAQDYAAGAFVWRSPTLRRRARRSRTPSRPSRRMVTSRVRWTRRPRRSTRSTASSYVVWVSRKDARRWEQKSGNGSMTLLFLLALLRLCVRPYRLGRLL